MEDDRVFRTLLVDILSADPEISVIAAVENGRSALKAIAREKPDVITMDIHMPVMDGVQATRQIMSTHPIPIVLVTSSTEAPITTFDAMAAGALMVLDKPVGPGHEFFARDCRQLVRTVKAMSEVSLVRRTFRSPSTQTPPTGSASPAPYIKPEVIAIGASTGGPQALMAILSSLEAGFPLPIVIVQHIASGFLTGLIDWLDRRCPLTVRLGMHDESLTTGSVYFAPEGLQTGVYRGRIQLGPEEPYEGHLPSVSHLFNSVANAYAARSVGVLLTGMGSDGATGMKRLYDANAYTIAQDQATSLIYGMPAQAQKLGAVKKSLPIDQIAKQLARLASEPL